MRPSLVILVALLLTSRAFASGVSFGGGTGISGVFADEDPGAPTVFRVVDSEPDGDFDDADVEAALSACDAAAPENGCRIELIWGRTYTDAHVEVGPHVRYFRGADDASILQGSTTPSAPIILREARDGGWGTRFTHFKIDGQKQNLTSMTGSDHNCIYVNDPTSNQLSGGVVRSVTCESVAYEGFKIEDAPGWTFADNTLRYLGCYDGPNADGGPLADWSPNGIDANLMKCGTWGGALADDDNQPGRKTPGNGIEIQRNSHNAIVTGNMVEYYTKIGIQGIDSSIAPESSYPTNGQVRGNTVQWGLSGISMVRTNGWTVDDNDIFDIGSPWQFGNVGNGTGCSFAGRGNRFTNNDIRRTNGVGLGVSCDCGSTIGGGDSCGVVATGNRIEDACQTDTSWGTIFANNSGNPPNADGLTITGNAIVSSGCLSDLNLDGYTNVTTDIGGGGTWDSAVWDTDTWGS